MKNKWSFYLVALLSTLFSCRSANNRKTVFEDHHVDLISDQFSFTEGPAADQFGNVYFTDQPNDKIYLWDWKTNKIELFKNKTGRANGTFFDENDNLITCSDESGEILKISKNRNTEVLSKGFEGKRLNGPNDLWIDQFGGIYFTDPLYERDYWENFKIEIPEKNLYYRNKAGKISKIETFIQPNGIIGSKHFKKLYVSDINAGKTYVYDILGEGKLSGKKLFCEMGSDGMTLDEEGNLYLTGDGVTVFNNQGQKIHHIAVPEKWTANLTFGGEKNNVLFITASKSVYKLSTKTKGVR